MSYPETGQVSVVCGCAFRRHNLDNVKVRLQDPQADILGEVLQTTLLVLCLDINLTGRSNETVSG